MRYRALDANRDMTFGQGGQNFLINSPAAVAQAVDTKLRLWMGEWFLDLTEGTPYPSDVLGSNTAATRDSAIRDRILSTPGVSGIVSFSSELVGRAWSVSAVLNTIYGQTPFSGTF